MKFKSKTKQKAMVYNYMSKYGMRTGKNEKQKMKIHQ